jgi:hypothetical protein
MELSESEYHATERQKARVKEWNTIGSQAPACQAQSAL